MYRYVVSVGTLKSHAWMFDATLTLVDRTGRATSAMIVRQHQSRCAHERTNARKAQKKGGSNL
jgi:hypothetical protein